VIDLTRTFLEFPLWVWLIAFAIIILLAILVARKLDFEGVNITATPPFFTFRFKRKSTHLGGMRSLPAREHTSNTSSDVSDVIEKKRRIDAVVPSNATIGQFVDLLVQVRFLGSPHLGFDDWSSQRKPPKIERAAEVVSLRFPVDS
jgi:hypothetical protein